MNSTSKDVKGLNDKLFCMQVEPGNKSSDDDDESGRYDRFGYSDKKGGKVSSEGLEGDHTSNSSLPSAADSGLKEEHTSPKDN